MFQYLLAFLLINSYYQSLGVPIESNLLISNSLSELAKQCENAFLTAAINEKIEDCAVSVPPYTKKKQMRCLIFYDISKQLCEAVALSKIKISDDYGNKISEQQEVSTLCKQAKNWVFTNLPEYVDYKNTTEHFIKLNAVCGEICGVEDTMNEANDYCKYYKLGIETLNVPISTTTNVVDSNAIDASEQSSNPKADIPVKNAPIDPPTENTKSIPPKTKQTDAGVIKTIIEKTPEETGDVPVQKSTFEATSANTKTSVQNNLQPPIKSDVNQNLNAQEHPEVAVSNQASKPTVTNEPKPDLLNDPGLLSDSGKDNLLNMDTKDVAVEKTDGKAQPDIDDYPESEDKDPDSTDDDPEEQGLDIKTGSEAKQESFVRTKIIASNGDISQKEFYPNTMSDGYTEDGDHFFPFFLTAVILVVLLYVLYHNKNKVTKVFFGLILEGRQSNRRRNSRGHAYRRLDTLEQAMSANTAAPPSKIIY